MKDLLESLIQKSVRDIQIQEDRRITRLLNKTIGNVKMEVSIHQWSLGYVLIGSEHNDLFAVELGNDINECYRNFYNRWSKLPGPYEIEERKNFQIVDKVISSMESGVMNASLKINYKSHPFSTPIRYLVWETLLNTAPGETISYKEIANKIGNPKAVRAIGSACRANPFAIIIPCHRVIKSDGTSGEYRWGIDLKRKLLDKEKSI